MFSISTVTFPNISTIHSRENDQVDEVNEIML